MPLYIRHNSWLFVCSPASVKLSPSVCYWGLTGVMVHNSEMEQSGVVALSETHSYFSRVVCFVTIVNYYKATEDPLVWHINRETGRNLKKIYCYW